MSRLIFSLIEPSAKAKHSFVGQRKRGNSFCDCSWIEGVLFPIRRARLRPALAGNFLTQPVCIKKRRPSKRRAAQCFQYILHLAVVEAGRIRYGRPGYRQPCGFQTPYDAVCTCFRAASSTGYRTEAIISPLTPCTQFAGTLEIAAGAPYRKISQKQ